ncbi:hypothetical protein Tco_1064018 [Tanacetum coccineum]
MTPRSKCVDLILADAFMDWDIIFVIRHHDVVVGIYSVTVFWYSLYSEESYETSLLFLPALADDCPRVNTENLVGLSPHGRRPLSKTALVDIARIAPQISRTGVGVGGWRLGGLLCLLWAQPFGAWVVKVAKAVDLKCLRLWKGCLGLSPGPVPIALCKTISCGAHWKLPGGPCLRDLSRGVRCSLCFCLPGVRCGRVYLSLSFRFWQCS